MFDPAPFPEFSFHSHYVVGTLGFIGGCIALMSVKGSSLHKVGGRIMVITMSISALTALYFMQFKFSPPPIVNSVTALYGLLTAVLALRRSNGWVKHVELGASLVLVLTLVWFLSHAIPNVVSGNLFIGAPLSLLLVGIVFLGGDAHYFLHYKQRNRVRIRRHMVRILLTFAVLMRAPLFELREELGLSLPLVLIAPLALAFLLIGFYWRRSTPHSAK